MSGPHRRQVWHAECAIKAYNEVTTSEEPEPTQSVQDLLSDLMHYCDANAVDFDAALSFATDHYGHERG